MPLLALWTGYRGIYDLRRNGGRGNGVVLTACAAISLSLCVIYFVGYQTPDWTVQQSSVAERVAAMGKVLTFGFGAATRTLWSIFVPFSLALLLWTAWAVVRTLREKRDGATAHIIGLGVFIATGVVYAAALGWGRAGVVRVFYNAWPTRYMLLIVPLPCAVYLVWEFCGPARQRAAIQAALFAPAVLLVPVNAAHGQLDSVWMAERWRSVKADLKCTVPVFAQRHRTDLNHAATVEELAASIRMLKRAGRWPFTELLDEAPANAAASRGDSVRKTIRYHLPGASEAVLVWGVNGWQAPAGTPPERTTREDGLMRTFMLRSGDGDFEASLPIPRNATLEFGFMARDAIRNPQMVRLWEGPENWKASSNGKSDVLDIYSGLRFDEHGPFAAMAANTAPKTVRYRSAEAARGVAGSGISRMVSGTAGAQAAAHAHFAKRDADADDAAGRRVRSRSTGASRQQGALRFFDY